MSVRVVGQPARESRDRFGVRLDRPVSGMSVCLADCTATEKVQRWSDSVMVRGGLKG